MKRILPLILALTLVLSMQTAFADSDAETDQAEAATEELEIADIDEQDDGGLLVTVLEEFEEDVPEDQVFDESNDQNNSEDLEQLENDVSLLAEQLTDELPDDVVEEMEENAEEDPDAVKDPDEDEDIPLDEYTNGIPIIQPEGADTTPEPTKADRKHYRNNRFNKPSGRSFFDETIASAKTLVTNYFAEPSYGASKKRLGRKTVYYLNKSGRMMWSVTIHGTYAYNGKNASCKSAYVTTGDFSPKWKISRRAHSRYSNSATGSATAKRYGWFRVKETRSKSVTLKCNKNGGLS